MEWARTNTTRGIVVALLCVFVVGQAIERDWGWLAIGSALLVLNLILWRAHLASSRPPGREREEHQERPQTSPQDRGREDSGRQDQDVDTTLAELMDLPGVADAWASAPPVWRQVSYLDDEEDLSLAAAEVAEYVWVTHTQGEWSIAVEDEVKPVLDLDVPEDLDALVATVAAHPAVAEVQHVDREQYDVVVRGSVTLAQVAALAARGVVAHHLDAVRRLTP